MRRPPLVGRARCEGVSCLGWSSVMEIASCSRSGVHSLKWHRNSACLDYNRGEMRGGRGGLWKEMKGDVWGKRGSDLHGGEDGKRTRKGQRRDVKARVKSVDVTCLNSTKSDDDARTAIDHRFRYRTSGVLTLASCGQWQHVSIK